MIIGIRQIGSWGDYLWHTPVCKVRNDITFHLHNDEQCRTVSRTFDNLAKVEFVEMPPERLYIINKDKTHFAQRILNQLEIKECNCIPKVALTNEEINWARNYLKIYDRSIIVSNDNQGANQPSNYCAVYKRPPVELMQWITNYLINLGYNVLQFGPKKDYWVGNIPTFTPLKGAIHIRELDIRQQLACFFIIGKMVSGDTGLYHAQLATGGKVICFHPPESNKFGYNFTDLHYTPDLWKEESIRVKYIDYSQFNGKMDGIMGFLNEL